LLFGFVAVTRCDATIQPSNPRVGRRCPARNVAARRCRRDDLSHLALICAAPRGRVGQAASGVPAPHPHQPPINGMTRISPAPRYRRRPAMLRARARFWRAISPTSRFAPNIWWWTRASSRALAPIPTRRATPLRARRRQRSTRNNWLEISSRGGPLIRQSECPLSGQSGHGANLSVFTLMTHADIWEGAFAVCVRAA
jgi:hypothetical protein